MSIDASVAKPRKKVGKRKYEVRKVQKFEPNAADWKSINQLFERVIAEHGERLYEVTAISPCPPHTGVFVITASARVDSHRI